MFKVAHLRVFVVVAWLALVAGIMTTIARQDRLFALRDTAVAALAQKAGSVQVRSEGLVRWQEAVERQGLFDGDRIATGHAGAARVAFGTGRAVNLGEDTQIQITAITSANQDPAFMIALMRGTMIAAIDDTCAACSPLVIRAGNDTYNVGPGSRVGVAKPAGAKAKRFTPPPGKIKLAAAIEFAPLVDAPSPAATPGVASTFSPTPKAKASPKRSQSPLATKRAIPDVRSSLAP